MKIFTVTKIIGQIGLTIVAFFLLRIDIHAIYATQQLLAAQRALDLVDPDLMLDAQLLVTRICLEALTIIYILYVAMTSVDETGAYDTRETRSQRALAEQKKKNLKSKRSC